jgi:hypothetical protein
MLSSYPDYGKAPPEYVLAITEYLAALTDAERAALAHPVEGIAARCKYLPTIADMAGLLRERREKADAVRATRAPSSQYFSSSDWVHHLSPDARKRQVVETLGYDPADFHAKQAAALKIDRQTVEKAAAGQFTLADLKTQAAPVSPQLRALLAEQNGR